MAQLVNVISPITTSGDDLFLQTIFFPVELYASQNGTVSLDAYVECGTFETRKYGPVPYIDVSASYDPGDGGISINIVNRHRTETIQVGIENQHGRVGREGVLFEINGEDIKAVNSLEEKENVKTVRRSIPIPGDSFVVEVPPHSVSMVQAKVGEGIGSHERGVFGDCG